MYELIQVGENSFYMDCPSKVGFYRTAPDEVVLIDSGSDKDAAKKVKKILDAQGWKLSAIYNTHSHADHIGGNQYLQNLTGCKIYVPGIEGTVTEYPILEPVMLYGGKALKELQNKFLMAKESKPEKLTEEVLPEGMEIVPLPGHSYDMVGFKTKDNVIYLADSLASKETLAKYEIGYIFDIQGYIDTLEMVKGLKADCFVPAHAPATKEIAHLAQFNIEKTYEIASNIKEYLTEPVSFEDLLVLVFEGYHITMNLLQRMLIGCTVKSYLTYLVESGQAEYLFENNKMLWKAV